MVKPGRIVFIFSPTKIIIFLILTSSFSYQLNLNNIPANSVWRKSLERTQDSSWYKEGLPGTRIKDLGGEAQGSSPLKNMRSLSITNNLEILRDRLLREIGRKRSAGQVMVIYGNGRG